MVRLIGVPLNRIRETEVAYGLKYVRYAEKTICNMIPDTHVGSAVARHIGLWKEIKLRLNFIN
jgi:hypothetical protein